MPDDSSVADVLAVDETVLRSTGSVAYGVTDQGFEPKPFARILAEKLALARALFGTDVDLTSGSAIRKLLEISALEDSRTWTALGAVYTNSFVSTATGAALTQLGEEVGVPRPFLPATGTVDLTLQITLPTATPQLQLPRGLRMLTAGGHHVSLDETVVLTNTAKAAQNVRVAAFYPGPSGNLDPASTAPSQVIALWNLDDPDVKPLADLDSTNHNPVAVVGIVHTKKLTGGQLQWPDDRYRELLLRAPRSLWTAEALQFAAAQVPGVRQAQVRDDYGGLDIYRSIFGDFNFIERVFSAEREFGSPYYLHILVAPTPGAIWEGPGGVRESIESVIEDLRPISIFPSIDRGVEVGVGIAADLIVHGIPLPEGGSNVVNSSEAAKQLKARLLNRVQRYVESLTFGEPVRASEVTATMMAEPGVADVVNLRLLRYPPGFDVVSLAVGASPPTDPEVLHCGENVVPQSTEIAVFVDVAQNLDIVV
jgi:hypothetical protein